MSNSLYAFDRFSDQDIKQLSATMKVGILGTVTPEGLPHLTLITTLMACSPKEMVWGQFMEGVSKQYIRQNPKTGFMVMGLDRNLWRGCAEYSHSAKQGPDYDFYNNTPLFRYNAYFGVHTVHYMNLVGHNGKHPLPMNKIIPAAIKTMIAKTLTAKNEKQKVLNDWSRAFYDKIDNLKFLGYVGVDGYPVVLPVIQAQSLDREHLIFFVWRLRGRIGSNPGLYFGGRFRHGPFDGGCPCSGNLPGRKKNSGNEMRHRPAGLCLQSHAADTHPHLSRDAGRGGNGVLVASSRYNWFTHLKFCIYSVYHRETYSTLCSNRGCFVFKNRLRNGCFSSAVK